MKAAVLHEARQPLQIEELESALVGDDCCLPAEGEPSGNDLLVERRGEPGESVQATPRAQEMSLAGMVGEHVPVEIVTAGLLRGEIARLLGCELEELVVVRAGFACFSRHVTPTLKNIQGSCDMQGGHPLF